jgi:hypothetical protein
MSFIEKSAKHCKSIMMMLTILLLTVSAAHAQQFMVKVNNKAMKSNRIIPVRGEDMIQFTIIHKAESYEQIVSRLEVVPCHDLVEGDQFAKSTRHEPVSYQGWFKYFQGSASVFTAGKDSTVITMASDVLSNCPGEIFYVDFFINPTYQSRIPGVINGKLRFKFIWHDLQIHSDEK